MSPKAKAKALKPVDAAVDAGRGGHARFSGLVESSDARGVRFTVRGVDLSIVNSARRVMMSEVPTVAFAFSHEPAENEVVLRANTTALHNEFMGHRLSLVPICLDENAIRVFQPAHYKFVIRRKNDGRQTLDVTSQDIQVFDQTGAKYPTDAVARMFPADPITGDHVLICQLRPGRDRDADGEELHAECVAALGVGKTNARWSPVSTCFFRNTIDAAASDAAFAAKLALTGLGAPSEAEARALRVQHDALDAYRHFERDVHGEPCAFDVHVVSECGLRPAFIFFKALLVLRDKLTGLHTALATAPDDVHSTTAARLASAKRVTVEPFANAEDLYLVTVHDEDHTLGNLLQGMLYNRWVRDGGGALVSYIGYHQPHPLEDHIVVKVKCAVPGDDVRARLAEGTAWLRGVVTELATGWAAHAGLAGKGIVEVEELLQRGRSMAAALLQ